MFYYNKQVTFLRILSILLLGFYTIPLKAKEEQKPPIENSEDSFLEKEIKKISGKAFEAAAHTLEYPSQQMTLSQEIQVDCNRLSTLLETVKKQQKLQQPSDILDLGSEATLDCHFVTSKPEISKKSQVISLRLAQYKQTLDFKKLLLEELKETSTWASQKADLLLNQPKRRPEFAKEAKFRQARLGEMTKLLKKWNRFQKESQPLSKVMSDLSFIQEEPAPPCAYGTTELQKR